jgi:hypothetical protein
MKVRCLVLWFSIIWALIYIVGEILLLMNTEGHCTSWTVTENYFLENTFATCLILSMHMKSLEVFVITSGIIYITWTLTEVHVHCLVRELLLVWEDTCKNSTINIKVIDKMNINWISVYFSIPERNKFTLFAYKGTNSN